jgi:hypothetical protein
MWQTGWRKWWQFIWNNNHHPLAVVVATIVHPTRRQWRFLHATPTKVYSIRRQRLPIRLAPFVEWIDIIRQLPPRVVTSFAGIA